MRVVEHWRMLAREIVDASSPHPGSVQGQVGRRWEQPGLVEGEPANSWGLEQDLPIQAFL